MPESLIFWSYMQHSKLKQLNVKIPNQELIILKAFSEKTERTKTLPTQSQRDRIAEAARLIARIGIQNPNPLQCAVVAELINDRTIDALAVIDCWDTNYHQEWQKRAASSQPHT
jgi:hypothetical protein